MEDRMIKNNAPLPKTQKTLMLESIKWCSHEINIKYCTKCQKLKEEKKSKKKESV